MNRQVRAAIGLAALTAMSAFAEAGSKKGCSHCGAAAGSQFSTGGYAPGGTWGTPGYVSSPYFGANFGSQGTWPSYGWANSGWGSAGYGPNSAVTGPVIPLVAPGDELVW